MRQFRGEIKPSKHRFEPSEQNRRTSLQERLSEVASLQVSHAVVYFLIHKSTFLTNLNFQFETHTKTYRLYLCHSQEVRLIRSEGLKRCFEGLFHPEIGSDSD